MRNVYPALTAIILFISTASYGQIGGTMNSMDQLFQTSYTSPAKTPSSSVHFGLPVASGISFSIINTGFSYYGLPKDANQKTLNRFLRKLGDINYFSTNTEVDLFSFGIRLKKGYFSVYIREKLLTRFTYPGDLLKVFIQGNGGELLGQRTNLDGLAFDLNHYKEVAFGYSQKFGEKIRFGVRGKLLLGYENLKTNETRLGMTTKNGETDHYQIEIDGKVDMISSGINSLANAPNTFDPLDYLGAKSSQGIALDFGAEYQATEFLKVSASVIDLGGINYNEDIRNLKTDNISFVFDGVDIFQFVDKNDSLDKATQTLLDSLDKAFELNEDNSSYFAPLNGKVFFGAELKLFRGNSIGAFANSEFINGRIKPAFSGFYSTRLTPSISATVNFAYANRTITNMGAGIIANIGSFQLYAITDNLVGVSFPARARTIDLRAGINLRFGNGLKGIRPIGNRKAEKTLLLVE